jgi:hypothetical protein
MTTEANALISRAILARIALGADLVEAFDAVFGTGSYERMAGELYDTLRARAV